MDERERIARLGEVAQRGLVVVEGEAELLEVVGATHARRRLADLLNSGEKQADQDRDDGDHDQELDQGEGTLLEHWQVSAIRLDDVVLASEVSGHFSPPSRWYSM